MGRQAKSGRSANAQIRLVFWIALGSAASPAMHAQTALPDVVKPPPSINLGSTSFYDGFGRTRPGVTVLEYFRWTHDTEFSNGSGNENPAFEMPRLNAFPELTQWIVATKWHPPGGVAGFTVLLPLVDARTSFAAASPKKLSSNGFGIGDVVAGPIYQSKFYMRSGKGDAAMPKRNDSPYLAYRAQLLVQMPTGEVNAKKSLNQGSGYWALAPYVAATYLPTARLEMSTRLHYQYNLATDRLSNPPPIPNLVYKSGQAGQLVYGNFTTSYRFTRRFYFGANSYELYQLSPDRTNGKHVSKARETQAYLGPGGGFDFNPRDTLNVNLYLKLEAHNTASGPGLQLLYIHRF